MTLGHLFVGVSNVRGEPGLNFFIGAEKTTYFLKHKLFEKPVGLQPKKFILGRVYVRNSQRLKVKRRASHKLFGSGKRLLSWGFSPAGYLARKAYVYVVFSSDLC